MSATAPTPSPSPSLSLPQLLGKWTTGVPVPLLFVAGTAVGILFASLIVLFTHARATPTATASHLFPPPVAMPAATWQPNVIVIHPAAPDPMFDAPPAVEPAALHAPAARPPVAPPAKKAVTRNAVRRHAPGKPAAAGDLLTAAL